MNKNLRLILVVFAVLLMFSSVYGLIGDYHPAETSSFPPLHIISDLSPVSQTGSGTSISVSYWTQSTISNSATTSENFGSSENSSGNAFQIDNSGQTWTGIPDGASYSGFYTTYSIPSFYYWGETTDYMPLEFQAPKNFNGNYEVGTVYANLTAGTGASNKFTWSTAINYDGSTAEVYIYPNWNLNGGAGWSAYNGVFTLTVTVMMYSGHSLLETMADGLWTDDIGSNGAVTTTANPYYSPTEISFAVGWSFANPSGSYTFSIPQYESSFNISWSSQESMSSVDYNSETAQSGTSGSLIGSLTVNSISFTLAGDPSDYTGIANYAGPYTGGYHSSVGFGFYLSSQYRVSTASASETSSPSYTFSQVSGTTNEANASFSFSGSTPSTAVFIPYETSTLDNTADTNIQFTPSITLNNPYYTYTQNQLTASLTGASTGSYSGSNTENPTMTGNSVTYTSSASPSWTVSLNLYGNIAPTINTPTASFSNSGSEISATFTISQNIFNGELQDIVINWGDGTTSSYNDLSTGSYTYYHNYTGTYQGTFSQTYSPYITVTNVPNPASNGLSGLTTTGSSTSYTFGLVDNPNPSPDTILKVGQPIYMNLSATNLIISGATVSVNGLSPSSATLVYQKGSVYDFKYSSSLFGVSGVTITWTIDPAGITDIFSTQYATPIEPTTNSSYVTALFSNTATHSYQITLSGVPSGTGFYQQLLTISDPSSYGINTITSPGSNVQFTAQNGTLLYAWEQTINSSALQVWVKNYYGNSIIDMQVLPSFENDFSETGYLGNATISNIKYVFPNMTVSGTAGLADTLPTGSLPGSVGFYAYSVGGDYIYMPMQDYGTNTNISFYVWSNGLGDFFFDANSAGTGNAFRFDTRSGSDDSQFMPTNSWTSWGSPPVNTFDPSASTWYEGIIHFNSNGTVIGYWSYASQNAYGQNATSYYTVAHDGNYIGFIGDGYGSAYVTYWNGLKINGTTSMPLATISSIGTGSVFQANATADNTTSQHYASFGADAVNLTDGEYTYSIPDSFNSNYITIYYNPAWSIDYASYGFAPGVQATSSGTMPYLTFAGVSGIGTLTMTFTEPLVIGQPLGTMAIGTAPSIAINGVGYFNLPTGEIDWYANGKYVNPSGFSVVVGKPITLTAKALGQTLNISTGGAFSPSITYTPTSVDTFLQTYLNMTEIQLNNYNSQYEVQVYAKGSETGGIWQLEALLAGGQVGKDIYLPSGSYDWKYIEINQSNGIVVQQISTDLTNNSGSYWITIAGETLYSLGNQLTFANASIQKSIQSLSIIVSLNDSAIKNLTLSINANLSITNSSIKNYMTQVLVNESTIHSEVENYSSDIQVTDNIINSTVDLIRNNLSILQNYTKTYINSTINSIKLQSNFINDTMKNLNLSFSAKVAILNSTLDNLNLNSTTYFNIEHDIINNLNANQTDIYHAAELSGAYSYKLIPENVTTVPKGIEMQLWVTNHDGTIVDDPQLVYFLWKNMSAEIISVGGQNATRPILISYNAHYMTVEFYLNATQVNNLESGSNNTVLQLYSPFTTGGIANIATGSISPATTTFNQGIWEELGFSTSPPPWTGTASIPSYITWILYNAGGRAIAGIVAIATLLYIVIMLYRKDKKKGRTKRQILTDKKVDAIYDNVVGGN